jgi:hypothetical protein
MRRLRDWLGVTAALVLHAAASQAQPTPALDAPPSLAACDRAAAAPHDPARPATMPGLPFEALDPADAPLCEQARRDAPEVARLPFQLARLRERAGRDAEAAALYREAASPPWRATRSRACAWCARPPGWAMRRPSRAWR